MEQIYTIPVNEAFDASAADSTCGCPMCALYRKLEENELELILGASMMEPDVRIKTNELATRSGVTPSSVYSMLDPRRKEVSVNLVKKLCDGLDMTLGEFFSAPVFDELEQEIQ